MAEVPVVDILEGPTLRAALRDQGWGDWADAFCDAVLAKLGAERLFQMGASFISLSADGSVNIRWTKDSGWDCQPSVVEAIRQEQQRRGRRDV